MRAVFGIGSDEIIIGMVARFQKYRRTEVFLEAMKMIVKEFPNIKVLLVGRSGQMEESVIQPMKKTRHRTVGDAWGISDGRLY